MRVTGMPKIFISYRRSDTSAIVARIYERLANRYGQDEVHFDFTQVKAGEDFMVHLSEAVNAADVFLVILGRNWRGAQTGSKRAIDNDFDSLRLEIAAALKARKTLIPVLVDGAEMPAPDQFPEELRNLSYQNFIAVDGSAGFSADIELLISVIDSSLGMDEHAHLLESAKQRKVLSSRDNAIRTGPGAIAPAVVLSYRRNDSKGIAGRLFDEMEERLGRGAVYMDIDSIPFGINFRTHIEEAMKGCKVVVALIGPSWTGKRFLLKPRIFDNNDPVRIEIQTALKMELPIIPVLLDETRMPKTAQLPRDLQALCNINAAPLDSGRDFKHHAEGLINSITQLVQN